MHRPRHRHSHRHRHRRTHARTHAHTRTHTPQHDLQLQSNAQAQATHLRCAPGAVAYVWYFCCGCSCLDGRSHSVPAGKGAVLDASFSQPQPPPAFKRAYRHGSGIDVYANAVFPPISPGAAPFFCCVAAAHSELLANTSRATQLSAQSKQQCAHWVQDWRPHHPT